MRRSPDPSAAGLDRRRRPPDGWRALAGPCLLLTAVGAVSILFLHCCARKTQLDSQLRQTLQRVEQLRSHQQEWTVAITQERDPERLRTWAGSQGMVFAPAQVDHIRLSQSLPPPVGGSSPLAALVPPPVPVARAPGDALARAPSAGSPE